MLIKGKNVMKLFLLILCLISSLFFTACRSESVVGKWKAKREYDTSSDKWKDIKDNSMVEFRSDGTGTISSKIKPYNFKYTIDTNVTPHRVVMTDDSNIGGKLIGIYRIEVNKLLLKNNLVGSKAESEFPSDFSIEANGKYSLSEFERQ
jgi:hypothetical protein